MRSLHLADAGGGWAAREWRELRATRVDDTHWRAGLAALPPAPAQPAVANARDRGR